MNLHRMQRGHKQMERDFEFAQLPGNHASCARIRAASGGKAAGESREREIKRHDAGRPAEGTSIIPFSQHDVDLTDDLLEERRRTTVDI